MELAEHGGASHIIDGELFAKVLPHSVNDVFDDLFHNASCLRADFWRLTILQSNRLALVAVHT
jgi:hypothetical protein